MGARITNRSTGEVQVVAAAHPDTFTNVPGVGKRIDVTGLTPSTSYDYLVICADAPFDAATA